MKYGTIALLLLMDDVYSEWLAVDQQVSAFLSDASTHQTLTAAETEYMTFVFLLIFSTVNLNPDTL